MRRQPMVFLFLVVALLTLGTAGCGKKERPESSQPQSPQPAAAAEAPQKSPVKSPNAGVDRSGWPAVVAFGDSLTAGLGVPAEQNYPSQLQAELDEQGYKYRVVNAGISGDLSAGGLSRVAQVLEHKPRVVILELGANDGLQGKSPEQLKANLSGIIQRLQAAKVTVVLTGMMAPPNYGPEYTQKFQQVYMDLAEEYKIPFVPFFLQGVGGVPELNLADGIHPTAEGYSIVVQNLLSVLEPVLQK